jgi:hypothetical protein
MSVVIPIIFNTMMTTYSLIQEIIHNEDFNVWCKKHSFIISMLTILSSADVEALHILSSKIAGLNAFSAPPLSSKISRLVFWAGCINIFLEDIPQFIIQVKKNLFYHYSITKIIFKNKLIFLFIVDLLQKRTHCLYNYTHFLTYHKFCHIIY